MICGWLHRDIKLDNLLVSGYRAWESLTIEICDFGLAGRLEDIESHRVSVKIPAAVLPFSHTTAAILARNPTI